MSRSQSPINETASVVSMMVAAGVSMIQGARADILAAIADHVAKAGHRRLHAEAEERQPGFEQDHLGKHQRHRDDQRRRDVGKDMTQDRSATASRRAALTAEAYPCALAEIAKPPGDAGVAFPADTIPSAR